LPWLKEGKINLYFAYFVSLIVEIISLYFALVCPSKDKEKTKTNSTDLSILCLLCPYFAYFVPTLPTMYFTHTPKNIEFFLKISFSNSFWNNYFASFLLETVENRDVTFNKIEGS
jgi:hypothetical protein